MILTKQNERELGYGLSFCIVKKGIWQRSAAYNAYERKGVREVDECEQVERLFADGRCFLVFSCLLPDLPQNAAGKRMKEYLTEAKNIVFSCAEAALPVLARRYREDPDPKKAFRQRPPIFFLEFSVREKRRAYCIAWGLRLSRCGRTISQKNGEVCFDKRSGYLLGKAKG